MNKNNMTQEMNEEKQKEFEQQLKEWEDLLGARQPNIKYFKCSFVTKKWLEVYVKPTEIKDRSHIYIGIPIYEDNRFKMGKLRAFLDDGNVKDFAIEAPFSMRPFATWNYSDASLYFRSNIIFTA